MAIFTFNNDSLMRGKVNRQEVKEVLDDPMVIEVEEAESKGGNPTVMYVEQTQAERLLEVGVEFKEQTNHVYHARKANARHKRLYEGHWR